jgi:hypothetical protein
VAIGAHYLVQVVRGNFEPGILVLYPVDGGGKVGFRCRIYEEREGGSI